MLGRLLSKLWEELQAHRSFVKRNKKPQVPIQSHPDIRLVGKMFQVPPRSAPVRAPLYICRRHWPESSQKCPECERVRKITQPKQPCTFYSKVVVNDPNGSGSSTVFDCNSDSIVPLLKTGLNSDTEGTPCNIHAFAFDANGIMWVSCSRYWGYSELKTINYQFRTDFSKANEVVQEISTQWLVLDSVLGKCYIIMCSAEEFKRLKRRKELPNGLTYFTRDTLNSMSRPPSQV